MRSDPAALQYWYCAQNKQLSAGPVSHYFDALVQDCSNSSALAMELLQSCTKPSFCAWMDGFEIIFDELLFILVFYFMR